jgi:geranylgeranyl pyrophosphate synthase
LAEGQGAELLWRTSANKVLTPLDALKIYALKTAPAFEAALYAGIRLGGDAEPYEKTIVEFSKNLGVAFQILNDLKDWSEDSDNKLLKGQDVLAGRPTLLLALALEGNAKHKTELLELLQPDAVPLQPSERIERVRHIFQASQVFAKADKLVEKYRARAEALADEIQPAELRTLLYYLVDNVLDRPPVTEPAPVVQFLQLQNR